MNIVVKEKKIDEFMSHHIQLKQNHGEWAKLSM